MKRIIPVLTLLWAAPAAASCHLMEIVEIFGGTASDPNAHYVVLRMTGMGQTIINTTSITTTGGTFGTFSSNASNGALGSRLLMATAEAEALLTITADHTAPGTVLLGLPSDTVTYSCSGNMVPYGAGVIPELIPGCALIKSGTTWSLGDPAPTNNAGASGSLPGSCVLPDAGVPEPVPDLGPDAAPDLGADLGADLGPDAPPADAPAVDVAAETQEPPAPDAATDALGTKDDESDDGCSCRIASVPSAASGVWGLWVAAIAVRRRRRQATRAAA